MTNTTKNPVLTQKSHTHTGDLRLIRPGYPVREGALPELLVPVTPAHQEILMTLQAAKMMSLLLVACGAGRTILPVSGYRSGAQQRQLYEETLREKGEAFTRKYVALPGCSEHETGLALDLGNGEEELDAICPELPHHGVFGTFRALSPRYGFIERYPEGKSHITGIGYEPWHFRYVGWPHSVIITQQGWTLEEYLEELQNHTCPATGYLHRHEGREICIYTVTPEEEPVALDLPASLPFQLSGNNMGGVVVTLWRQ